MRAHLECVLSIIALLSLAYLVQAQDSTENVANKPLHTAVTGRIDASGLDNPEYVLSFVSVQRLMLDAVQGPVTKEAIQKAVQGTPVTLDHLLRLELLREDQDAYWLNYLLLTVRDQEKIYQVGAHYGQSLAEAFRSHKTEFSSIINRYPIAALRPQLMFDLIAGVAMDWEGLDLTTELGYRAQPPRHAVGGVYLVHSKEEGARLDITGLYWDSQDAPGSKMSFATFGDGASLPRLRGLPDVFDGLENAMEAWRNSPEIFSALRSEYITLVLLAIDDASQLINAVGNGIDTDEGLAKQLPLPNDRREAALHLLTAIGYLKEVEQHYFLGVPVLTEKDKPLVDATLKLSREIMTDWLQRNYPSMKNDLSTLSPMRNGLPFSLAFSEVWHYEFGFATKSLAESGFYGNPRAQGNRYEGYVPLVWANSVLKRPQ